MGKKGKDFIMVGGGRVALALALPVLLPLWLDTEFSLLLLVKSLFTFFKSGPLPFFPSPPLPSRRFQM